MSEQIQRWMELYNLKPSLILVAEKYDEEEVINKIIMSKGTVLNPLEVVLESLINIISLDISIKKITISEDKVFIDNEIKNEAAKILLDYIKNDEENQLRQIHRSWLIELKQYLEQLYSFEGNLKIEEVLFRISNRFRISGSSAINAILSLNHVNL